MQIADDILRACLAGDLGDAGRGIVDTALAADRAIEVRPAALNDLTSAVRDATAVASDDPRIDALPAGLTTLPAAQAAQRPRGWSGLAIARLVGLSVGWGGKTFASAAGADWQAQRAHDQLFGHSEIIDEMAADKAVLPKPRRADLTP